MTQMSKGELLVQFKCKNVTLTIKEISPEGVRTEINNLGEVTGKYNARYMETASILRKPDGSMEWENKIIQMTQEGDTIMLRGEGKGRSTGPATVTVDGEVTLMTPSARFSWLNNTRGWFEASGDTAKGEFQGRIYASK